MSSDSGQESKRIEQEVWVVRIVLVLVLVLERVETVVEWLRFLRTGVQIDFCPENTDFVPKGLQDSARGFNPGYGYKMRPP